MKNFIPDFRQILKQKEESNLNKNIGFNTLASTYSMTFRSEKGSKLTIDEMDGNFHYLLENGGGGSVTGTPSQVL